jgi:chloramphenicol 3-O-phosphotransferase
MAALQEMARLVRDELITLIQPVQLLSVNPNSKTGAVTGRFRSSGLLYDYNIGGGRVRYKPVGQGRSDAADASHPTRRVIADLRLSRERIRGRWSAARLDGYRAVSSRFDKKNCTKGYGCGATCIETSKECIKEGGAASEKLAAAVKGAAGGGGSAVATPGKAALTQRRVRALTSRRAQLGKALVADLMRPRPDGMGNFIENPDRAAMQKIKTLKGRVAKIDRQLNVLEGKDPEEKRWLEGDPFGLSRYSDFQSPGREAYEGRIIAAELSTASKGDQAVFMSGGPASGKTSLLKKQFGEAKGFVVVDPDRMKGRDPVMELGVALGMRKAAALAHENSSRLSKKLYAAARDQGLNVLMDGTGANADKYIGQMRELQGKGYKVTLLAQHVPEEVGVKRALGRADRTGRYVPKEFIKHAYEVIPGNFEKLARVADSATLNDGESNQVIMSYKGGRYVGGDRRRTADYRSRYGKP